MLSDQWLSRLGLFIALVVVILTASACYKNAGENVQPTSNRVDLSDIQPTTLAPPTAMMTVTPTVGVVATMTSTLRPTITPAENDIQAAPATATSMPTTPPTQVIPSPTPTTAAMVDVPPTSAPVATEVTPDEMAISTPGMSDVQASPTPAPTIDPAFQPTATPIPPGENPCIHVVQPDDTLFSIAQDNEVTLSDLVAANPETLAGSENTPLQIGWTMRIPGCDLGLVDVTEPDEPVIITDEETPVPAATTTATGEHVVQAGETIFSIGRLYGVDPYQIIEANNLANPNLIRPGDVLVIPPAG